MLHFICIACGDEFVSYNDKAETCSRLCRSRVDSLRYELKAQGGLVFIPAPWKVAMTRKSKVKEVLGIAGGGARR